MCKTLNVVLAMRRKRRSWVVILLTHPASRQYLYVPSDSTATVEFRIRNRGRIPSCIRNTEQNRVHGLPSGRINLKL